MPGYLTYKHGNQHLLIKFEHDELGPLFKIGPDDSPLKVRHAGRNGFFVFVTQNPAMGWGETKDTITIGDPRFTFLGFDRIDYRFDSLTANGGERWRSNTTDEIYVEYDLRSALRAFNPNITLEAVQWMIANNIDAISYAEMLALAIQNGCTVQVIELLRNNGAHANATDVNDDDVNAIDGIGRALRLLNSSKRFLRNPADKIKVSVIQRLIANRRKVQEPEIERLPNLAKSQVLNEHDESHLRHQRLYLIGDPYAGKTTFLRKLMDLQYVDLERTDFAEISSCEIDVDSSTWRRKSDEDHLFLGEVRPSAPASEPSSSPVKVPVATPTPDPPPPPPEIPPFIPVPAPNPSKITSSTTIRVDVFDCGGQSVYISTHQYIFSPTGLYVLVVDVSKPDAFETCKYWIALLKTACKGGNDRTLPFFVVLTHLDLSVDDIVMEKIIRLAGSDSIIRLDKDLISSIQSRLFEAINDIVQKQTEVVRESLKLLELWRKVCKMKIFVVSSETPSEELTNIKKALKYGLLHADDFDDPTLLFGDLNLMIKLLRGVINTHDKLLDKLLPFSKDGTLYKVEKALFMKLLNDGLIEMQRVLKYLKNAGIQEKIAELILATLERWRLAFPCDRHGKVDPSISITQHEFLMVPALMASSPVDLIRKRNLQSLHSQISLPFMSLWELNQVLFQFHNNARVDVHSTYQYGLIFSPTEGDVFIHLDFDTSDAMKRLEPMLNVTMCPKANRHQVSTHIAEKTIETSCKLVSESLQSAGLDRKLETNALKPKSLLLSDPAPLIREVEAKISCHELTELHTHLLGMGSHKFWIHDIMQKFLGKYSLDVAVNDGSLQSVSTLLTLIFEDRERADLQVVLNTPTLFKDICQIEPSSDPNRLSALPQFSYLASMLTADVVFSEEILLKGLFGHDMESPDCPHFAEEERLLAIEKTVSNASCGKSFRHYFRHYIVYNDRESKFQLIYGLPNGYLVAVMELDVPDPSQRALAVRAALYNCFSMLNRDGSLPKHADLNSYRGCFTPKFYPMRYALKDPLYHQKPEILTLLLNNACRRYFHAGVSYIEFSVGINDLLNKPIREALSRRDFTLPITVKYLAAFPRTSVKYPCTTTGHSVTLREILPQPPHLNPVHFKTRLNSFRFDSLDKIQRRNFVSSCWPLWQELHSPTFVSIRDTLLERMFPKWLGDPDFLNKVTVLLSSTKSIVGFDLVGEEDGNPFNPFVHESFQALLRNQRENNNPHFGIRLHCGEGVQRGSSVNEPSGGPQHRTQLNFVAHMNIMFADIQYLTPILKNERCVHDINRSCCASSLRLGHGIAFAYPVKLVVSTSAASCALEADFPKMRQFLRKHEIAFELNLTSNDTLLNDLFDDPSNPFKTIEDVLTLFLEDIEIEAASPKLTVVLSTDDDGIWPIHKCPHHYRHISVASEFCRAILSGSILSVDSITRLIQAGQASRFYHPVVRVVLAI